MRRALLMLALLAGVLASTADAAERNTAGKGAFRSDYDEYFRKYTKHTFGVGTDWSWFKAQAIAESNLNPQASSAVRAHGIMQLMPATYAELQKKNPDFGSIDEPRWNIAAGIYYDRQIWNRYGDFSADDERRRFMFGAYNAGPATMTRARSVARSAGQLDSQWNSVVSIAPRVPQWRHRETLNYVSRIEDIQGKLTNAH